MLTDDMTRYTPFLTRVVAACALAVALGWSGTAQAQTNPNRTGGGKNGKRPFVMIVMDSSASMEWTEKGEGVFPKRGYSALQLPDPYPDQPTRFEPSDEMGVGDGSDGATDYNTTDNPLMFGSCLVWEPQCSEYERPSWNPSTQWTSAYDPATPMGQRFQDLMRGDQSVYSNLCDTYDCENTDPNQTITSISPVGSTKTGFPVRLLNNSQPRHVTFKEILTGEMILKPEGLDKAASQVRKFWLYGPGCWFVPRQRGASVASEPVCCKSTDSDGDCTDGYAKFEQFPDHTEPRPHMQEVYDGQLDNGLMDSMERQVIFSVASFDSYKWPLDGGEYGTSGERDYVSQTLTWGRYGVEDTFTGEFRGFDEDDDSNYNYGLRRVIAPNKLTIPRTDLSMVSDYTQYTLLDMGTLKADSSSDASFELDPSDASHPILDFSVRPDAEKYIGDSSEPYLMSQHPIAGATPLAPAMYDVQHFFENSDLFSNDRFKQCRPKHVVLMTDGVSLPERPPTNSNGTQCDCDSASYDPSDCRDGCAGHEGFSSAFELETKRYEYEWTEEIIRDFVQGDKANSYIQNDSGTTNADKFNPRVHVVGTNIQKTGQEREEAIRKLASMAKAGKTCAGARLKSGGNSPWIPEAGGDCPRDDHPCLVDQPDNLEGFSYTSFSDPDSGSVQCEYPALILKCNGDDLDLSDATYEDRKNYRECKSNKWYKEAFQRIFNQIIRSGGLNSRTRPAFTSNLDTNENASGQYRLYSGLNVDSSNPFWKGKLTREFRRCSNDLQSPDIGSSGPCGESGDGWKCFHKDVNEMIEKTSSGSIDTDPTWTDRRRIFTSIPKHSVYDLAENKSTASTEGDCGWFHSTYEVENAGTSGEFRESYLDTDQGSEDNLLHRRVPFEYDTLDKALTTAGSADDDSELEPLEPTDVNLSLPGYFGLRTTAGLKDMIDEVRGRNELKYNTDSTEGAALGAILNSDPVVVDPPNQNAPIESYRQFKSKYANRPSMLYVGTIDGMLHAMYTGSMGDKSSGPEEVPVRNNRQPSEVGTAGASAGTATEQREAWAYIPHMLHDDFARFKGSNPYLLDGTPVVQDVRLCHPNAKYNQNYQACQTVCDDGDKLCTSADNRCVPPSMQWRTVLVQGLGQAGSGYFALDVTRPGGPYTDESGDQSLEKPDPVPLWEFDPSWEEGQIEQMVSDSSDLPVNGEELVYPPSDHRSLPSGIDTTDPSSCSDQSDDSDYFWKQPFMGRSVGKPALGTVVMRDGYTNDTGTDSIKRPIAVFTAGQFGSEFGTSCNRAYRVGQAIYVVDLQTGSLLRRFVGYEDTDGWSRFKSEMVGTPELYDSSVGNLVTRGFVGDSKGRMFRIDFGSENPADWSVSLFYDPKEDSTLDISSDLGPAAMEPAVTTSKTSADLMVVYGLGDRRDTTTKGQKEMVMAIKETSGSANNAETGDLQWVVRPSNSNFKEQEKLTGKPVIFNENVYFTSYYLRDGKVCQLGKSRIWGLDVFKSESSLRGAFNCSKSGTGEITCDNYLESDNPVLIRGATVELSPACTVTQPGQDSPAFQAARKKPTLIAQTGNQDFSDSSSTSSNVGKKGEVVKHHETNIRAPESQSIPMSWSVITR